jgi:hypothetical protein
MQVFTFAYMSQTVHAPAKYNDYKNEFIHNAHVTLKSAEVN